MWLDAGARFCFLRDVFRQEGTRHSSTRLSTLLASAAFSSVALLAVSQAAQPFNSARITKVENKVSYGERQAGRSVTRPASVADTLRASNFLLSEADSRAEIQYPDGSLVRIGQNTVFSFDAESRTLSLDKGSMIFHVPKGAGGGTIKTPSLTAAITGTTGKVTTNIIAIIEGTVRLVPSGRLVHAGEFARANADGSVTIAPFSAASTNEGRLVFFPDLMPGFPIADAPGTMELAGPDLRSIELKHRANNLPNSIFRFEPVDRNRIRVRVPEDDDNTSGNGGTIY